MVKSLHDELKREVFAPSSKKRWTVCGGRQQGKSYLASLLQTPPANSKEEAQAKCRMLATGQCAPICLSYPSILTTQGKCPEVITVWGNDTLKLIQEIKDAWELAEIDYLISVGEL